MLGRARELGVRADLVDRDVDGAETFEVPHDATEPAGLGEARVVCAIGGRNFSGQGVSPDVLEASAIAYLRAVNASRFAESDERVVAGGV